MIDPRPETIEDLPIHETSPERVALLEMPAKGFGNGLGAAADNLIAVYRSMYDAALTVEWSGYGVEIRREPTEAELTAALTRQQRIWDRQNKEDDS